MKCKHSFPIQSMDLILERWSAVFSLPPPPPPCQWLILYSRLLLCFTAFLHSNHKHLVYVYHFCGRQTFSSIKQMVFTDDGWYFRFARWFSHCVCPFEFVQALFLLLVVSRFVYIWDFIIVFVSTHSFCCCYLTVCQSLSKKHQITCFICWILSWE